MQRRSEPALKLQVYLPASLKHEIERAAEARGQGSNETPGEQRDIGLKTGSASGEPRSGVTLRTDYAGQCRIIARYNSMLDNMRHQIVNQVVAPDQSDRRRAAASGARPHPVRDLRAIRTKKAPCLTQGANFHIRDLFNALRTLRARQGSVKGRDRHSARGGLEALKLR